MNRPSINGLCDCPTISLLNLGCVPTITSIPLADHMLPLDCLHFWGIATMSGPVSHPLHITMFWDVPSLPRTSCYPKTPLIPKKRASFKLLLDSLNIKILSSYWPFQLIKVRGSAIPPINFNIFGPAGLLNKNSSTCLFQLAKMIEKSSLSYYFILFWT